MMKIRIKRMIAFVSALVLFVGTLNMSSLLTQAANYSGVLSVTGAQATSSKGTEIYLKGTDGYLTGSDSWANVSMMPESDDLESGIFVDGVRMDTYSKSSSSSDIRLRKYNDTQNWYYMQNVPNVQEGTIVTVKGTFYTYNLMTHTLDSSPIEYSESSFRWNGSTWEDYVPPTTYSGELSLEGAQAAGDAAGIYLKGTDTMPAGGWNMNVSALDEASGIYINDVKHENAYLRKYNEAQCWYYVGGFSSVSDGDKVTIKGKFGYSAYVVTYDEITLEWKDGAWSVPYTTLEENVVLDVNYVTHPSGGDANGIYLTTTDSMPAHGWSTNICALDGAENGVFYNGETSSVYLRKHSAGKYYVCLANKGIQAQAGDEVTIKGRFGYDGYVVDFIEITFSYDGQTWSVVEEENYTTLEENVVLELDYAVHSSGGDANGIYLTTTDSMPAHGWSTNICALDGADNGVFYNGETSSVYLRKHSAGKYYVCLANVGIQAQDGDEVTIKGRFGYDGYVVDFNEVTYYYNGQTWACTYVAPTVVDYVSITLEDLNGVSEFNEKEERWNFYVNVQGELPGAVDSTRFEKVIVTVNGVEHEVISSHSYRGTFYFLLSQDIVPHLPEEDMLITVKAGNYLTTGKTEGICIEEDFNIYINQYGMSCDGFLTPYVPAETNVKVALDSATAFGGNESGIYLTTEDHFRVDKTWSERIRAVAYDDESGVFYDGTKVDAILKKHSDGKLYVDLAMAGISAQDKDIVVVQGTFYLDDYAVSYEKYTLYYNGKMWNTKYVEAKEVYVDIAGVSVNQVSRYNEEMKRWEIYIDVEGQLPGEIDKLYFDGMEIYVDGQKLEARTYHSYRGCLFFIIPEDYLSGDAPDGIEITMKAGKTLSGNQVDGIVWTKDFSIYTFLGRITEQKPTKDTKWQDIALTGLPNVARFNETAQVWGVTANVDKALTTENNTVFYQLPIYVNDNKYEVTLLQAGACVYFSFTEEALPRDAKTATLTIKKGSTAIANAGRDGIRITEDFTLYMYNGVWSDYQYDETIKTEIKCVGMQNADYAEESARWNLYFWADAKIPGNSWYEQYSDFVAYYNGQEFTTRLSKAGGTNGRLFHVTLKDEDSGTAKEGDILVIKPQITTCGAYEIELTEEFAIQYRDGVWSEYVETNVTEPADEKSLWELARFDSSYIPISDDGMVTFSSSDSNNCITSLEDMKDYTVSFSSTKLTNDNGTSTVSVVLRGRPIDDITELSTSTLYGYVVEFKAYERAVSEGETIVTGTVNLWKNGRKTTLKDSYLIAYQTDKEAPFYSFGETNEYEFSIYNVTETCVCITVKVNDEVVLRHYDHAGSDPMDPAINTGVFAVYAEGKSGIYDDIYEVDEVLTTATECRTDEPVWVAGSYPYVINKTQFTIDKESASIANGVFMASEAGEYQVTCTYDGKEITPVTIVVDEAEVETDTTVQESETDLLPIILAGSAAVLVTAGIIVWRVLSRKKKKALEN